MAEKRLEDMLWKNILRIKTESDEQFARYILEARSEFLRLRLRQEPALRKIYLDAADRVADEIRHLKPSIGPLMRAHLAALEKSLRQEAERISQAITKRLEDDLPRAVEAGAKPLQQQLLRALQEAGADLDFLKLQRGFGDVNTRAVEAIWARTRKGLRLSDRIWQTGENVRTSIRDILQSAVARGQDAIKTAREVERYLRTGTLSREYANMMRRMGKRVPGNLAYEALRLARTEISMAFMEGTYAAGRVNPSYRGARWMLSAGHPMQDICDDLASADLYGLGPGGYPAGEEPMTPHPNCLCYVVPLVEDTKEFIERLKRWQRDPGSEPDLEKWYNEIWRGQQLIIVVTPSPVHQKAERQGLSVTAWKNGIRKLAGKKGLELDAAVDALRQQFRSAFQADLEFESGFLRELSQRVKGNKLRKAVMKLAAALNRMPIEATRDNPMFAKLRLGGYLWGAYGDFNPALGIVRIAEESFRTPGEWAPDRLSHAYETLIHEIGHAAHRANTADFMPFFDEMWELPLARQGEQLWNMAYYKTLTGHPKDWRGITNYGATDPLEDFADTWRLLYLEQNQKIKAQIYEVEIENDGSLVYKTPVKRFQLLRNLLTKKGWKVPK